VIATALQVHPYADLFPPMSTDEFAALVEDIRTSGQREPIVTYQGKVVDGRNRLRACIELNLEPITREWDGQGSLVSLIVSLNLHRRHLTQSQRNAIGADIEPLFAEEAKGRLRARRGKDGKLRSTATILNSSQTDPFLAREKAAQSVGGSPSQVSAAKVVKQADPQLHEDVKAGKISLHQATRKVMRAEKKVAMDAKVQQIQASKTVEPTWEVITGDFLGVLITARSPRLVFADPPYNIGIDYGVHYNDSRPFDEYEDWCRSWIKQVHARLAWDGTFMLLIGWEWAHHLVGLAVELGLHHRQTIVWYETFGVNCARKYNRTSRALVWFTKHRETFVWNPEAVNRPSDRQVKYNDSRADPAGKTWDDVWGINPPIPRLVDNHRERIPGFPTQLPLDLLRPIVGAHSDPGDLVLDPFSGSGTTGCAAIELGRRFVGIELSEEFAELSRKRLLIHSNGGVS